MNFFQIGEFYRFYRTAVTKYQLHSTFVFELACAVLEDQRRFYAFRDVEAVRNKMLDSNVAVQVQDYGTGSGRGAGLRSVRSIVRQAASSAWQGQLLFRLANHFQPKTMLELGSSVGIGTMYLASARRGERFLSLEGSPELAHVARTNLEWLGLSQGVEIREGTFEQQLAPALHDLKMLDFVFLDGNHRMEPTLRYFEQCLGFAHDKTVFVFDDVHGSPEMSAAWEELKKHPKVRLSIDFFEVSMVLIDPDFREKQHFNIVPARWKPWMFF